MESPSCGHVACCTTRRGLFTCASLPSCGAQRYNSLWRNPLPDGLGDTSERTDDADEGDVKVA
eukprot:320435-Amphidinium_carterae.1